jgi:hypothetical protein
MRVNSHLLVAQLSAFNPRQLAKAEIFWQNIKVVIA